MKENHIVSCTHPVPPNQFGIFAMHCPDNQQISPEAYKAIFTGPIAAVERDYHNERAEVADFSQGN